MERHRAVRRALLLGAGIGLVSAVVAVVLLRPGADPTSWPVPGEGEHAGLQVEVLNGSGVSGLARAVTTRLRRAGVDVVSFGTAAAERDTTVLLVRRGDPARSDAVRRVLGLGQVVVESDPGLLVDVSVILGRDAAFLGRDP